MNIYLDDLSKEFANDMVVIVCDGAIRHKSKSLNIPNKIKIIRIPHYTSDESNGANMQTNRLYGI